MYKKLTNRQTVKFINWLNKNLDEIEHSGYTRKHWILRCSEELGFLIDRDEYSRRLYEVRHGTLAEKFKLATKSPSIGTYANEAVKNKLLELADEMIKSEQLIAVLQDSEASQAQEIFDLKVKLDLEVENNRQLANTQVSSDQLSTQAKIIEKLKDDKNKEFIRMSAIIAEQKDEILNLRSEVESLKDKITDLEITKSVNKGYGQFGFNFNIPQPSVKF